MRNKDGRADVLIVDDEAAVREVLLRLLEEAGIPAAAAANGADAIELFHHHNSRIIISDIRMSPMNGFELIRNINGVFPLKPPPRFLVITALPLPEIEGIARKLGVTDFFEKPLNPKLIINTVLALLTDEAASATGLEWGKKPPAPEKQPKRIESEASLRDLVAASDHPVPLGQVFCIGIDDIRKRVGDSKWRRLKDRVTRLIVDAVQRVCRRDDVFLECPDGSVLVVFAGSDQLRSEAAIAKAARMVNEALFGAEDYAGAEIRSFVQMAGGEHGKSASEILDALLAKARLVSVGLSSPPDAREESHGAATQAMQQPAASPASTPQAAAPSAPPRTTKNAGGSVPSFRSELLDRFRTIAESPIEFRFLPILNVQRRKVDMFICLPSRKAVSRTGRTWGYGVLGNSPGPSEICDLDIACLELGLMSMMDHLSNGKLVSICPCLHFETLGSKKNRERVIALLEMVPDNLRSFIYPIVMQIPDGIMESRLAELIGPVRSHVNFLAAEVFPQKATTDLARSISRLRAGGIECILINLPRDHSEKDVHWARQLGDRIAALGGKAGVTGIRTRDTLIELAYSSMEYCAGPAVGGPYEAMPEPLAFDPKTLET